MTTETDIDIQGINGDGSAANVGLEHGEALMQFAEGVATRDQAALDAARQRLLDEAGPEVLVDAAGVAANFQRMVRIADSIGIPVDDMESELGRSVRDDLGLERFLQPAN